MSDKTTIYEITQLMGDKNLIQNDLNEALNTVKDIFYKKYIQKFQIALDEHKELATKESSKEIQLLNALKPFVADNSNKSIDKIISTMCTINTAQSIDREIKKCSTALAPKENSVSAASTSTTCNTSTTIHEDGIYEIDESCKITDFADNSINITEIIFMLLLTGIIQ